jgi:unsaturated pyranuronate lyase
VARRLPRSRSCAWHTLAVHERDDLVDIGTVPALDVWGDTVQARVVAGERVSLALVELAAGAIVPEHRHEHEQLGIVIEGRVTFTIDGRSRELGPGGTWRIPSNAPHDVVAGADGAIVIDIFSPVRTDWGALPRSEARPPRWPRPG